MLSLRQRLPVAGGGVDLQLDLYNLLNLLDGDWGTRRVAAPGLLEHVGQTTGSLGSQPVFRFQEAASAWTIIPAESTFQLQLGLTYRF